MNPTNLTPSSVWVLAVMALAGCESAEPLVGPGEEPQQVAPAPNCDVPDPTYDGVYGVTFSVQGQQSAVGAVTVADGKFLGDIVGLNASVQGEGCVVAGGQVIFERVESLGDVPITVSARIEEGIVAGEYTVATPQGMVVGDITGSLNNRPTDESHTEFDGTYDVIFFLGEDPRSIGTFEVENSGFTGSVPISTEESLAMQGYVTSDGLAILSGVEGTLETTMAEAQLDHDTFEATGIYRWGGFAGKFIATRRAE